VVSVNFQCDREKLLEAIQVCQRAISGKGMLPILSGILFKSDKNVLHLSSTDLEISIRTTVEIEAKEGGALVVPARLISDILNSLDNPMVELKLIKDKNQLEIQSGESRFNVSVYFEEDFPKIPEAAEMPACAINNVEFLRAAREVVKAASKDESKPVLTGVLVEITSDSLRMVATDSYRLAVCETKIEGGPANEIKIIVPARSLRELNRVVAGKESGKVAISLTENQVVFRSDNVDMISRLIDGDFPNYKQIIPEGYEKVIKLNKNNAIGSIKRAAIMAQNNSPIKMTASNKQVVLAANTQDVGEAVEKMEADYSGDEIKIAFNPEYLLDGITSIESEDVALEITDPLKPAMIKPVGDSGFQYLIMPVRLT
jgi:DNA polymerase-3 subunit beta